MSVPNYAMKIFICLVTIPVYTTDRLIDLSANFYLLREGEGAYPMHIKGTVLRCEGFDTCVTSLVLFIAWSCISNAERLSLT